MFEKYCKILQLGDNAIKDIFEGSWVVEEKIDGSNFRFGIDKNNNRFFGSKEVNYSEERPVDKMFVNAVKNASECLDLAVEKIREKYPDQEIEFFTEYLSSIQQNSLTYSTVPEKNLVLLDVIINNDKSPLVYNKLRYGNVIHNIPSPTNKEREELKKIIEKHRKL